MPVTAPVEAVWPEARPTSPKLIANTTSHTRQERGRRGDREFEPTDTSNPTLTGSLCSGPSYWREANLESMLLTGAFAMLTLTHHS